MRARPERGSRIKAVHVGVTKRNGNVEVSVFAERRKAERWLEEHAVDGISKLNEVFVDYGVKVE